MTFSVSLHRELQGSDVRLMVCCPGLVESEFHGPDWHGPPQMSAEDVVTACFRGLEAGEAILSTRGSRTRKWSKPSMLPKGR